jgi:hypothetical protein
LINREMARDAEVRPESKLIPGWYIEIKSWFTGALCIAKL